MAGGRRKDRTSWKEKHIPGGGLGLGRWPLFWEGPTVRVSGPLGHTACPLGHTWAHLGARPSHLAAEGIQALG